MHKNFGKVFLVLVSVFLISINFVSCKKEKKDEIKDVKPFASVLRGAVLNGPSGIGLVHLFENKPAIDGEATMEICATPDVLIPKMLKGEIDFGILPPNVAAKVYNKNNGAIVCCAVVGRGMLNLMTKDQSIKSVVDLAGKTINSAGAGSTPEYILRYLLSGNKIDANISFDIPNSELPAALIAGKVDYAFMPEPFATVALIKGKDAGVFRAFDVQKAFCEVSGLESYPMTLIVARREFVDTYPATTKMFLQSCAQSVGLVNQDPKEAGELVAKYGFGLQAPIVEKVIPNAAFEYTSAKDARREIEMLFNVFLEYAPEAIAGILPDDDFYR